MTNAPGLTELQAALASVALLISPLAFAGLALINTGLARSRNAAHTLMSALCAVSVAALVYFTAAARLCIGLPAEGSPAFLTAWLGLTGVALAALIPLGAGAERWRLSSVCASAAILAGVTFPLFASWSHGPGWLAQLGLVDSGGSGWIHATGGFTALAIAWLVGPRRGRYGPEGMPMAMPGHGVVFVLFGCFVAAAGWLGLNTAGAILLSGAAPGRMAPIGVNTMLGAASAAVAAALITRVRFGRPDASLSANGWVGGLVATSAGCAFLPPAAAVFTGLVAGALVTFSVELLEMRLEIDDPGGSISVHAVAGVWGLLAAGLLGRFPAAGGGMAQIVGIATLLGCVFPLAWGLNALLDRFSPMRVSREGERQGMDLFELGAGAWPDFVTHADDSTHR